MNIFIDNNVWDYFYNHDLDLIKYFPIDKYKLCITKHGKYEVQQMPDSCKGLIKYVNKNLEQFIEVDSAFGFYNLDIPADEQRGSGYGEGRYISQEESRISSELTKKYGTSIKRKHTQILFQQEADIELATRALENTVLTFDAKKGPLKEISEKGGKVLFLSTKEAQEKTVECFMSTLLDKVELLKS